VRNYSLRQRFKLWKAICPIDHISAAYPPLLDKNSAVFSTAIPQLFSAFSACFAHEMGASITVTFHRLLRSFSEELQRTLATKKGRNTGGEGGTAEKAVARLRSCRLTRFSTTGADVGPIAEQLRSARFEWRQSHVAPGR